MAAKWLLMLLLLMPMLALAETPTGLPVYPMLTGDALPLCFVAEGFAVQLRTPVAVPEMGLAAEPALAFWDDVQRRYFERNTAAAGAADVERASYEAWLGKYYDIGRHLALAHQELASHGYHTWPDFLALMEATVRPNLSMPEADSAADYLACAGAFESGVNSVYPAWVYPAEGAVP